MLQLDSNVLKTCGVKTLAIALGLLAAPAEACRTVPGNHAYEPVMGDFVRGQSGIYLARAISARALPESEQPDADTRPLYRYRFSVTETLKGPQIESFKHVSTRPFSADLPAECAVSDLAGEDGVCSMAVANLLHRNQQVEHAEAGRSSWLSFYLLQPFDPPGMGLAGTYHPDRIIIGCGNNQPGFEIGETFLIFRDDTAELNRRYGLNAHLIRRDDDAWLGAVRYFLDNPAAAYLPARTVEESLESFTAMDVVRFESCGSDDPYPYLAEFSGIIGTGSVGLLHDAHLKFYQRDENAQEARDHCSAGGAFLYFPDEMSSHFPDDIWPVLPLFPIRAGVVDFTHLATQWEIEGSRYLPLSDVLGWQQDQD